MRLTLVLILFPLLGFTQEGISYSSFEGGMSGYSKILLKLKYDKTYEYDEWTQTGKRLIDKGRWMFDDSSSSVIMSSNANQVSKDYYYNSGRSRGLLFRSDTFEIINGMIYMFDKQALDKIPEDDARDPRREFYQFRVLYRVMPVKKKQKIAKEEPDEFAAYKDSTGDEPEENEEEELFLQRLKKKLKLFLSKFKEPPAQKKKYRTS